MQKIVQEANDINRSASSALLGIRNDHKLFFLAYL